MRGEEKRRVESEDKRKQEEMSRVEGNEGNGEEWSGDEMIVDKGGYSMVRMSKTNKMRNSAFT